ncbi:hypothetical protein Sgou_44350 [Streptomyces gougerotii]|uniref:Integral membrane bound transporter domain-containing protein n=1 Tax=Streptomyces gougerotii TaxID=53448 RepID=A0ABQ1DB25_9ACTN|nr:hypothetical protein Sgou_44350 [Streptomyces gougerotii]
MPSAAASGAQYSRAVARFGGTLLGVFAATGVLQLTEPSVRVSALLAVACAALMYLLMRTGYAVSQFFVSAYVVLLLGMGGEEWTQTVPERVVLTLIGGLLAMASYAVFPAWETPRLRTRLADWLAAAGRYAAEVVERYATPAGPDDTRVRQALLEARAAHTAWQEALARAAHEPVRSRGLSRTSADDAEEAIGAFSRAAMLMEAHLPERGAAPVPGAQRLAQALRTTTEQGARELRDRRVPQWDEVRAALAAWDGEGVPDRVVRRGAGMLLAALEQVSEAVEESPAVRRVPRRAARRGRAAHLRYRVVTSPVGRPDGSSVGSEEGRSVGSSPGSTRAKVSSPAPSQETVRVLPSAPSSALPRARSVLPSAHFRASAWSWKVPAQVASPMVAAWSRVIVRKYDLPSTVACQAPSAEPGAALSPPVPPWSSSPASEPWPPPLCLPVPEPELSPSLPQPVSRSRAAAEAAAEIRSGFHM